MKKKLLFWFTYLTDPSFRAWVHKHDIEAFMRDIEQRRREMLEHQSRIIYQTKDSRLP